MTSIAARLDQLASSIVVPREEDGTPATLVGLLPCEIATGHVAVACWVDSDGGELIEVVELDSGERLTDAVALREALTLLAMVETVEELATFEQLDDIAATLQGWRAPATSLDISPFDGARKHALDALQELARLAPADAEPRLAAPAMLDAVGSALRELERAWELLEQQAELWSDAHIAAHPEDAAAIMQVQELWRILGSARRGPLAKSPGEALHAGREAGRAMAAAVLDAAG